MEHETVNKLTEVLRASGFTQIETRKSSTTLTVAGVKEDVTAVLHFTDTKAAPPPRTARAGLIPQALVTKAFAPGAGMRSGSGV